MLLAAPLPLADSSPVLAALLVSLARSQRVAEELARGGRLEQLLALAVGPGEVAVAACPGEAERTPPPLVAAAATPAGGLGAGDAQLWQLLRAMAEHDSPPLRARFAPSLERLARLLMVRGSRDGWNRLCRVNGAPLACLRWCSQASPLPHVQGGGLPPSAFAEALGCLACLDLPGHDYAALLRSTRLHTFLAGLLRGGGGGSAAPEEPRAALGGGAVLAEAVQAAGVLCADAACAEMMAGTGLVSWAIVGRRGRRGRCTHSSPPGKWQRTAGPVLPHGLPRWDQAPRAPCMQVDSLYGLMVERAEDEGLVLTTTGATARMLAQVGGPRSQGGPESGPELHVCASYQRG